MPVTILNRQRTRLIDTRQLRRILRTLLDDQLHLKAYELGITLVAAPAMTRLNETFLQHKGATDVITFDYSDSRDLRRRTPDPKCEIHGEIFICIDEAIIQARRFRTTWQAEVVRYFIHGILHLRGYDDHRSRERRRMKCAENRLVRLVSSRFPLSRLAREPRLGR
jgi:probable rRNA maturation factor